MSDLISRQDAIDAILKETVCATKRELVERCDADISDENGWLGGICVALDTIEDLPSAQPEIIRCKDCKWYGRVDKRRFYRGMDCLQKHIDTIVPDRDFCSKAERREE